MCKAMEDMRNEARAEGSKEKAIIVARKMLNANKFSYEEISEFTSLTLDEIKALATKQPA